MDSSSMDEAVAALLAVRRGEARPSSLPEGARPDTLEEAHAVQDRVVAALAERVAGWKVAVTDAGVSRGVILGSRFLESPASIAGGGLPLLGVEGEIAFRFHRDLPARQAEYGASEVADAADAFVGIEIVGTRFQDYDSAPFLDRTADCMSNQAFVAGTTHSDWQAFDLSHVEVSLEVNGEVLLCRSGGHAAGDPFAPAVALVNLLRQTVGVRSGQFITTGTFTGLHRSRPGDRIRVSFSSFGDASLAFTGEPGTA